MRVRKRSSLIMKSSNIKTSLLKGIRKQFKTTNNKLNVIKVEAIKYLVKGVEPRDKDQVAFKAARQFQKAKAREVILKKNQRNMKKWKIILIMIKLTNQSIRPQD